LTPAKAISTVGLISKHLRPFMKKDFFLLAVSAALLAGFARVTHASDETADFSPRPGELELPRAVDAKVKDRPRITVGQCNADVIGADNRALQAAVDYIAALGGGVVEIGEGEFLMRDSLHLRSHVTVRGVKDKTILRKAKAASSPLALDGDYGEEQITLA